MMKRKQEKKPAANRKGHHDYPLPGEISPEQKQKNTDAREQADADMNQDAELTAHSKNDDLDEGEAARLGEENTDLV
jgi:hypothetical protein